MPSSLAARAAAQRQMAAQGQQQQAQQPQPGFMDRNFDRFIEPLIGTAEQGINAATDFGLDRLGYNARNQQQSTPEQIAEAIRARKEGTFTPSAQEVKPQYSQQLSDALKSLTHQRLGRLEGRMGEPTNEDIWQDNAFKTAEDQESDQPSPNYEHGPQFPWEQFLSSSLSRHGSQIFGRQAEGLGADMDPNRTRNRLAQAAPTIGRGLGALAGGALGTVIGGPAGAAAGAGVGAGLGNAIGGGIGRMAHTGFEARL